jgi:hypothetical protein
VREEHQESQDMPEYVSEGKSEHAAQTFSEEVRRDAKCSLGPLTEPISLCAMRGWTPADGRASRIQHAIVYESATQSQQPEKGSEK